MSCRSRPPTPATQLAAIQVIAARGDMTSRNELASLSGEPKPIAAAATAAIAHIDFQLKLWNWLETVYYGLSLGSVLLLAAAGLAITFGVMGVINMAHGEMVMIGAYITFCVQQVFRAYAPDFFGTSVIVAIPAAFIVAGAIGILIERDHDPLPLRPPAGDAARHLGARASSCSRRSARCSAPRTRMSPHRTG